MKNKLQITLFILALIMNCLTAQVLYPGKEPGKAIIKKTPGNLIILENNVIRMELGNDGGKIFIAGFRNKETNENFPTGRIPLFEIVLNDSSVISSENFSLVFSGPVENIFGNPDASGYADRIPGKRFAADLEHTASGILLHWDAELRDGSNYITQTFKFSAGPTLGISRIVPVKLPAKAGLRKEGSVDGSPLVGNSMFFALEYPLSKVEQSETSTSIYLDRLMNIISTVWGVTPAGQMRRGFLYYLERERIHPYHQVLHYNSWYDISWNSRKFDEKECLDRIRVFGDSLIIKRKIHMDAFLFDDGWDDNKTLWQFHSGFPDGFAGIKKAVKALNADIGVWLSPFGGYDIAKSLRIEYGNKQIPPFETNERGFSLSGPAYYGRFKEVTGNFIKDYDVSMFKFDGVGAGSGADLVYQKDVEAFLRLLKDLQAMKPSLYLSLTTGTWPSPYWLMYGDNIWRGGDDTNMRGEGSVRQQWINYRDADTYENVVRRGPLFPLNALMLCGICIADYGYPEKFEMNNKDISDEIWSFFATGTNLQELYINPHKLNSENWDCLADAARWAKENESVMADAHWAGGDPSKNEVYGFAAWTPGKAVLSLRNPSGVEKTFKVSVSKVFELPQNVNDDYIFYDAMSGHDKESRKPAAKGSSFTITLKPFEVRVYDAFPGK